MLTLRDLGSAWAAVGLLALLLVVLWGPGAPGSPGVDGVASSCGPGEPTLAGVALPRGKTWQPDPALAGLPADEPRLASYELAEARGMERVGLAAVRPAPELRFAQGSSTSLKPTRMC